MHWKVIFLKKITESDVSPEKKRPKENVAKSC